MKKILFTLTLFFLMLIQTGLYAQIIENKDFLFQEQYFYSEPLVFYVRDSMKARADVFIQIPLTTLSFKKNQSTQKFDAKYDLTINIYNSFGENIISNTSSETISNTDEQQKYLADNPEFRIKSYFLKPDNYKLETTLRDRNNYMEYKSDKKFFVPDFFNSEVSISSIMFLTDFKSDSLGKRIIFPLVTGNIGELKDIYIFYEIYNNSENTFPLSINYKILSENNTTLKEGNFSYVLSPGVNQRVDRLAPTDYSTGFFRLEFASNAYSTIFTQKDFVYKWSDLPMNMKDLDNAINQMVYIATDNQMDSLRKAPTQAEKEKRFLQFWKSIDPSPKTSKNEVMNEYYNRIKIATDKFSTSYQEGWRTDMGMVFVIFGNPSSIERHPFDENSKPYEVWEYFDINKQFIFVDYTGFGDYRLITPIWDKRFKIR
ncbi:MAG: GWxTD domain-containing protein [Ignavibacteria bacterium]|nr:GWxTD domain-containing protein [Ignavibacteria bacterium]